VGDTPAHDSGEDAQRIQEILSGIPAGCTWLLPVRTAVFALSRVLNAVTPTPPSLREARERMSGRAA